MTDSEKLIKLKELLLTEDRDFAQNILEKLDEIESTINTPDKLLMKVDGIINKKLETYTEEIPDKLGPTISQALSSEIKNSQDKVVDILFPIIGKMIKKYIQQEMKALSDAINSQIQNAFSVRGFKRKVMSKFTGVSEDKMLLAELNEPKIEQIFIVEKGSGLIISSASRQESIDEDMIAGMLTAIKSFVEDAFKKEQQSLELIQYELFEIYIQNFTTYYFAVVISGGFNTGFKNTLENNLFDFVSENMKSDTIDKEKVTSKLIVLLKDD
ncbi:cell envelope biogenesis protein OmpA [Flavobacterium sp. SUN052]|uniref:cell envelope biogenesis protein OmpA n=1 Tax=Flavobacterium sp. SUN052 TaxID=3002441 RepID=UPI00237DE878|nr:cell envelope biogenesis protein OmpA [Flavobacterium sp. SUN052]MEC4004144.1 cell envelope biogenesis protein OmpA [Flavobacterium sp. SUN052]